MKKVAIYARVSTDKQTTENQLRELRNIADKNGWELVNEFVEEVSLIDFQSPSINLMVPRCTTFPCRNERELIQCVGDGTFFMSL